MIIWVSGLLDGGLMVGWVDRCMGWWVGRYMGCWVCRWVGWWMGRCNGWMQPCNIIARLILKHNIQALRSPSPMGLFVPIYKTH